MSLRIHLNYPVTRYVYRPVSRPIAGVCARWGITPDQATGFSTVLAGAAALLLGLGFYAAGGGLVLVAAVFDCVDGDLARLTNRVTRKGAFLDSVLDRWADAALILALGFSNPDRFGLLSSLAVVGALITSYTRARAQGLGADCPEGVATRDMRLLIVALAALSGLIGPGLIVIAVLGFLTSANRLISSMRLLD